MKWVKYLAMAIFIALPFVGFYSGYQYKTKLPINTLSPEKCIDLKGEIRNTISDPPKNSEVTLGKVIGLRCPCVCIVTDSNIIH